MAQRSAGINVGFGFVKVATERSEFRYASVVRDPPQADRLGAAPTPAQKVKYAGSTYENGENARLYGGGTQLKALHRDWANTLAYRVLAQSMADRIAEEGDSWSVVVGLALDHYKDLSYRCRVQQFWQRDWITANGEVKLARVAVVPEPIGAVTMLTADPAFADLINSDLVLVVDFGLLTTNRLQLRRGTPIPDHSGSVDCSMTAALAKAHRKDRSLTEPASARPGRRRDGVLGKAQIRAWKYSVRFKLAFDDLRFRLAEERAEPTSYGLAQRFRDLAVTGLLEEHRFRTRTLARRSLYTDALAGLADTPLQAFKVLLPTQLHDDFNRCVTSQKKGYARRFLRLVEIGLLFEQCDGQELTLDTRNPAAQTITEKFAPRAERHVTAPPLQTATVEDRVLHLARCVEELEW